MFWCLHLNLNGNFFPASEIWDFYPKARFLFIVISSNFFAYWRLFWNVLSYCRMVHRDDKRFLFFNYEIDFTVETVKLLNGNLLKYKRKSRIFKQLAWFHVNQSYFLKNKVLAAIIHESLLLSMNNFFHITKIFKDRNMLEWKIFILSHFCIFCICSMYSRGGFFVPLKSVLRIVKSFV